jgi:hypothetical protein
MDTNNFLTSRRNPCLLVSIRGSKIHPSTQNVVHDPRRFEAGQSFFEAGAFEE